jgi:hypothetical protein
MPDDSLSMQQRMKKLFTEGFTVLDIAEPLPLIDSCSPSREALSLIEKTRLPLLGVTEDGRIAGFLRLEDIAGDQCGEAASPFDEMPVLGQDSSLPATFEALADSPYCFVRIEGEVRGIVGRMDIQKAPVRMWLFGMVTIIEMFLTRIIVEAYPDDGWTEMLTKNRLKRAKSFMKERSRRGGGVRLIDCLQLSDKANIVIKDDDLFANLRFESKRSAQKAVREFESLRNNLAHSHDLSLNWDAILDISRSIDTIVTRI